MIDLNSLEKKIEYEFKDKDLLRLALTHSSYANEVSGNSLNCNERLEFLGDAILEIVVSEVLFNMHPDREEGSLTKLRASVVCESSLGEVGHNLSLNQYLLLGKGEDESGGRNRVSIIADAVEAVFGAVFLDGGFEAAKRVILGLMLGLIEMAEEGSLNKDSKTELQELIQKRGGGNIVYKVVSETGPDHAKEFVSIVLINDREYGKGSGSSKKRSEAAAASAALKTLKK